MNKDGLGRVLFQSKHLSKAKNPCDYPSSEGRLNNQCQLVAYHPTSYVNIQNVISSSTGFVFLFSENLITMQDSVMGFGLGKENSICSM